MIHDVKGILATCVSGLSTTLAWISIADTQALLGVFASLIAIISGIYAIRHFHYSIKEKKLRIDNLKNK